MNSINVYHWWVSDTVLANLKNCGIKSEGVKMIAYCLSMMLGIYSKNTWSIFKKKLWNIYRSIVIPKC